MKTSLCPILLVGSILALSADDGALFLDGVGDWVMFGNADGSIPTGAEPFTLETWINPTSIPTGGGNGGQMTFWGNQNSNQSNGFRLRGATGIRHYFWGNDHDENFVDENLAPVNILGDATGPNGDGWHHLALTYSGTQTRWYWNGAPLGNPRNVAGVAVADANYRIGSRLDAEFFHGFIDELRIWNVERTAQEVQDSFQIALPANTPGIVSYWDFGGTFDDLTGNGHDGTPMGNASIDPLVNAPISTTALLRFTDISLDPMTGAVSLTWQSRPNRSYVLDFSTDLLVWNEINDNIASEGPTTTFEHTPEAGTTEIYYRVGEIGS